VDGTVTKALSAGSIVLTKTSNNDGDLGIYELNIPIHEGDSIMGYFKFRKKSAGLRTTQIGATSPTWWEMYFGVEHGTFNTAAYAFLRNNGSGGSIVFGGPLQSYNTARLGRLNSLKTLIRLLAVPRDGWASLTTLSLSSSSASTPLSRLFGQSSGLESQRQHPFFKAALD